MKRRLTRYQRARLEEAGEFLLFGLQILAAVLATGIALEMITRLPQV